MRKKLVQFIEFCFFLKIKGKQGIQTVVPYRGDELCYRHLKVMGDLGQIVPLHFHLRDYDSIFNSVKDSKVVFNLVGSDQPTKYFFFFLFSFFLFINLILLETLLLNNAMLKELE